MKNHSRLPSRLLLIATVCLMLPSYLMGLPARMDGPWYVAPSGNDSNDCLSPATPCGTIGGVIDKAAPGDTVYAAVGTYTGTGDAVVRISKSITLAGGWDETFTNQSGVSIIDGQIARRGMAVDSGATVLVQRVIVQNGNIQGGGGGIYAGGSTLTLRDCAVRNNVAATTGGGILVDYSQVNLDNVTVSGNHAPAGGGGIYMIGDKDTAFLNVSNSTVSDNDATWLYGWGGGGINNGTATVYMKNSILTGNTASGGGANCQGSINSLGYNLVGDTSGCSFAPGTGDLLNMDAKLMSLVKWLGYYALQPDSPAIDAGNPAGCTDHQGSLLTTDQRGATRTGRCDIGAYESTIPGPAAATYPFSGTPQSAVVLTSFPSPLQPVVVDNMGTPVPSATVTFAAPAVGPSGKFTDSGTITTTAATNGNGLATAATFTANGLAGRYLVTATAGSAAVPATFSLTNVAQVFLPSVACRYCPDFFDGFSDPTSGWPVGEDAYVRYEYLNGEYRVLSKRAGYLYLFPAPTCDRRNYVVELDARWVGATGSSYGIVFGVTEGFSHYYLFDMNTDYQQCRLYRRDPSGFTPLVPSLSSQAIHSGTASNHMKVIRDGSSI